MFAIGDNRWSGVSKLIEEMGELHQVLGKLMGVRGSTVHWSGDLRQMLIEEMADVTAALMFVQMQNMTEDELLLISDRIARKLNLFKQWHADDPEE